VKFTKANIRGRRIAKKGKRCVLLGLLAEELKMSCMVIVTSSLSAERKTEMAPESLEGMADEQWAESSI